MPINGSHRPSQSQESASNGSRSRPRGPPGARGPRDSPVRSDKLRPRRNSESSIADKGSLTAEEERKRRERRRERERGERSKDGKHREHRSGRSKKPGYIDVIDKMDVTGLYGSGCMYFPLFMGAFVICP
jgi:hypothetical protein